MKIGNNTFQTTENGTVKVRLHDTVIYERDAFGTVRFYTGGYKTATTNRRMNQLLECTGWKVQEQDCKWFVLNSRKMLPFVEGISL